MTENWGTYSCGKKSGQISLQETKQRFPTRPARGEGEGGEGGEDGGRLGLTPELQTYKVWIRF